MTFGEFRIYITLYIYFAEDVLLFQQGVKTNL